MSKVPMYSNFLHVLRGIRLINTIASLCYTQTSTISDIIIVYILVILVEDNVYVSRVFIRTAFHTLTNSIEDDPQDDNSYAKNNVEAINSFHLGKTHS